MERRDPRHERKRVVVTDGERALQRRVATLIANALLILDFLHVLEHLWAAAHAFHREGTDAAREFVRERALRILWGKVAQVVKGIRQMVTKRGIKGRRKKVLLGVAGYFYRNRSRMRYDEYLRLGLPIASGAVEGACKNLVKDRMERSGMRWTPKGAEAMLRMRAIYLSGDFVEYWKYHVAREQARLHPQGRWCPVASPDGRTEASSVPQPPLVEVPAATEREAAGRSAVSANATEPGDRAPQTGPDRAWREESRSLRAAVAQLPHRAFSHPVPAVVRPTVERAPEIVARGPPR
jgi:hypothetical protein